MPLSCQRYCTLYSQLQHTGVLACIGSEPDAEFNLPLAVASSFAVVNDNDNDNVNHR